MLWVIRAANTAMFMVFKATRKLMQWYLEQQVNSWYGISSNKEIDAKGISSNKEINAPVSGTNILNPIPVRSRYL